MTALVGGSPAASYDYGPIRPAAYEQPPDRDEDLLHPRQQAVACGRLQQRVAATEIYESLNNVNSTSKMLFVSCLNWSSSRNLGATLYNVCPTAPSAKNNGTLQSYGVMNGGPGYSQFLTFSRRFVHDAFGGLAARYSSSPNTAPCTTWYLSTDHLGSVRLVTGCRPGCACRWRVRRCCWAADHFAAADDNVESRGKTSDPNTLPRINPGRGPDGNCLRCPGAPPPSQGDWKCPWLNQPAHWHWLEYNQDPVTCECFPNRRS